MKNLDVEKGIVSIKGKVNEMLYIDENQGKKLKVSLVSCLNELNNSVVYNAFNDWDGCLDWSVFRYISTFLKRQERKRWLVFIHDILFWIVQALFVFYVLLLVNEAELRIYVFLALLCGFAAYQSLLKALYMKLLNFLIYIFMQTTYFFVRIIQLLMIKPVIIIAQLFIAFILFLFRILLSIGHVLWKMVIWILLFIWKVFSGLFDLLLRSYGNFS